MSSRVRRSLERIGAVLDVPRPPYWMVTGLALLATLSLVPLSLVALARSTKSDQPRVEIFRGMGVQPKYGPQSSSPIFADGRSMRTPIPGTVARGELAESDHYHRGYTATRADGGRWDFLYHEGYPAEFDITGETAARGQRQFNVFCSPCHGRDGFGNGPVHRRAVEREEPEWVPPSSLHGDAVRKRAEGHLFNTISNGIRSMAGYGAQISVEDRWAIVLYVRALQRSQAASIDDVPAAERAKLR